MQYTAATLSLTKQDTHIEIKLDDLAQAFALVADPRRPQGRVYWLQGLLCLVVAGLLCNCLSVLAIAQWAALQPPEVRAALGLPADRTPKQSTLHRLLRRLDPAQLSSALTRFFDPVGQQRQRGAEAVALDGKTHRGQLQFEPTSACTIHDVSAFSHELGIVLAQLALSNTAGEAELSAAPRLVAALAWQGRVMTGDALYCQVDLCQQVLAAGGDYAVQVKANQPELLHELELLFSAAEMRNAVVAKQLGFDYRASSYSEKGHGRLETRQAIASGDLAGYSRWPGLAQVVQVQRVWWRKGVAHQQTHYVVTSLAAEQAGVAQLLRLKRGHWAIENSLHYVKDVTLGEDKSLIHVGSGGAIMAALRSAAVSLLHRAGKRQIAATLRYNSQRPEQALKLMGLLNSSDA